MAVASSARTGRAIQMLKFANTAATGQPVFPTPIKHSLSPDMCMKLNTSE